MAEGNIMMTASDFEAFKFFNPHSQPADFGISQCSPHMFSVSQGGLDNYNYVNKFGQVLGYGASEVDVTALATPGVYTWLQAAVKLEAISTGANAADDTNVGAGGTGARTITVQGLDANFDEIEEDISLKGASASDATTKSFIRIHRAFVKTSGTYATTSVGANRGVIVIRTVSAGATHIELAIQTGQSLVARYTIPAGWTGYMPYKFISANALKAADFRLNFRFDADVVTAPFTAKRIEDTYNGIIATSSREWIFPKKLPAKTDIWVSTTGAGPGTNASAAFDILLIRDKT